MAATTRLALVSCVLFALTVSGAIVNGPQNDAQYYGPTVVLECEADSSTSRVQWIEYATNELGAPISDGDFIIPGHPNSARYLILHPTDTVYDLQINPTVVADGGTYKCEDVNGGAPALVQLIMIDGEPECITNIPETGFVREDQYYTVECTVKFAGRVPPTITWSGPGDFGYAVTITNTSVWSGISINMTRYNDMRQFEAKMNFTSDGFIQTDFASNIPTWNYTYSTPVLNVQWAPKSLYIVPDQDTRSASTSSATRTPIRRPRTSSRTWTPTRSGTTTDWQSRSLSSGRRPCVVTQPITFPTSRTPTISSGV
jgi:hypothetical protein